MEAKHISSVLFCFPLRRYWMALTLLFLGGNSRRAHSSAFRHARASKGPDGTHSCFLILSHTQSHLTFVARAPMEGHFGNSAGPLSLWRLKREKKKKKAYHHLAESPARRLTPSTPPTTSQPDLTSPCFFFLPPDNLALPESNLKLPLPSSYYKQSPWVSLTSSPMLALPVSIRDVLLFQSVMIPVAHLAPSSLSSWLSFANRHPALDSWLATRSYIVGYVLPPSPRPALHVPRHLLFQTPKFALSATHIHPHEEKHWSVFPSSLRPCE